MSTDFRGWHRKTGTAFLAMVLLLASGCTLMLRSPGAISRDPAAESLRRIASETLRVGLLTDEVDRILDNQGLSLMRVDHSGSRWTRCYGTGKTDEPVLLVELKQEIELKARVVKWRVDSKLPRPQRS